MLVDERGGMCSLWHDETWSGNLSSSCCCGGWLVVVKEASMVDTLKTQRNLLFVCLFVCAAGFGLLIGFGLVWFGLTT